MIRPESFILPDISRECFFDIRGEKCIVFCSKNILEKETGRGNCNGQRLREL